MHTIHKSLIISDLKGSEGGANFHWSDNRLLILKLFLGCVCKLSVGHIQTEHTDFRPPQVLEGKGKGASWEFLNIMRMEEGGWGRSVVGRLEE